MKMKFVFVIAMLVSACANGGEVLFKNDKGKVDSSPQFIFDKTGGGLQVNIENGSYDNTNAIGASFTATFAPRHPGQSFGTVAGAYVGAFTQGDTGSLSGLIVGSPNLVAGTRVNLNYGVIIQDQGAFGHPEMDAWNLYSDGNTKNFMGGPLILGGIERNTLGIIRLGFPHSQFTTTVSVGQQSENLNFTLPTQAGPPGSVLMNDGDGNTSWVPLTTLMNMLQTRKK